MSVAQEAEQMLLLLPLKTLAAALAGNPPRNG